MDTYIVVTSFSPHGLQIAVNERLKDGYQPLGGVASGGSGPNAVFTQAMVQPGEQKPWHGFLGR